MISKTTNQTARKEQSTMKAEIEVIGKIGSLNVANISGFICLQCNGKRYIGIGKIKAVLANQVACKEFLAKYDVAKPTPAQTPAASAADRTAINKQIADLQAAIAKLTTAQAPAATAAANGRFVPAA